jgi:hypothetical protein
MTDCIVGAAAEVPATAAVTTPVTATSQGERGSSEQKCQREQARYFFHYGALVGTKFQFCNSIMTPKDRGA